MPHEHDNAERPEPPAGLPDDLARIWLATEDAADLFHVSPKTIARWAKEGRLPFAWTPGGHRRFPLDDIWRRAAALRNETVMPDPRDWLAARNQARSERQRRNRQARQAGEGDSGEGRGSTPSERS